MLRNLYIENIAVIEKTSIDFEKGLNVLTGETGAGKSIIIDSINAVIGNRTPRDLIRNGAKNAFVSAEFCELSDKAVQTLNEYGFETDNGVVILQREIGTNSKGKCRINGRASTTGILKAVGTNLINIHGQHESYELMTPELHITYIDKLGNLSVELEEYQSVYKKYRELKNQLNRSVIDEAERNRRTDILKYQVAELEEANLYVGEYEELIEQRNLIENKGKIASALSETKKYLNGDDEIGGALQQLESAYEQINEISDLLPDTKSLVQRLQSVVYEIEDCYGEVSELFDMADSEVSSIEEIEDRIDLIQRLGRKYGQTIEEMLIFLKQAEEELIRLENYEENCEKLNKECKETYEEAEKLAKRLSEKRKETAVKFSERVKEEMTFLDMPNVELVVHQEKCELNQFGCDEIEILISTNPGEKPKPVSKIASGGELSRMMLAIKNVLADKDEIDTLIFDEIDTGISGSAAQKVGLKLKEVSKSRQILCVTHLAQIAALGDNHFKIKKSVSDGKTYTDIELLDNDGRRNELARIMGGMEITQATLNYAEEMLKSSNSVD